MSDIISQTNKNELELLASRLSNDRRAMLSADTDIIYNTIVKDNRPKVNEKIFIQYFLEPFSNFTKVPADSPDIARWIDIAGSFYGEVDIVDNQGTVICTCPGIYKPLAIDSNINNIDFTNVAREFINKSNHFLASGTHYLHSALNYVDTNLHENTKDTINTWATILKYFRDKRDGIKPTLAVANKPVDVKKTFELPDDLSDFIEY